MLQLLGFALIIVGAWIRLDKTTELRHLLREVIDPAVTIMIGGSLLFFIAFLGCVGALRENLTILAWVRILWIVEERAIYVHVFSILRCQINLHGNLLMHITQCNNLRSIVIWLRKLQTWELEIVGNHMVWLSSRWHG